MSTNSKNYGPIRKPEKNNCRFWFLSPLIFTPKNPCLTSCGLPNIHPLDTKCHYRPLLTIGLLILKLLRKIFLPASISGISVVHAKGKDDKAPEKCDPSRKLVRACDLPVYDEEKKCLDCAPIKGPEQDTLFVETVKCVRKELWFLMDQTRIIRNQLDSCIQEIKANSEETLKYLREESNIVPRAGAIAVGGLSGYILALRRGYFRKLLYSSAGAAGMAALCYPTEAKEYSEEGVKLLKKYFIIGYHFMNGVSRDLTGYQLPPLPNGHLVISDSTHSGSEAVPSSAHLLPPTATPTHIPLPHEDPYEITKNHPHHQNNEGE